MFPIGPVGRRSSRRSPDHVTLPHSLVRYSLLAIGGALSSRNISSAESLVNFLTLGYWFKRHKLRPRPILATRDALYKHIAKSISNERVAYLEFGVFEGASLRKWSQLLRHPRASLHGFDSFRGLPEDWNPENPRGKFDLGGRMPTFDDPRVVLHPGWFEQTLPAFVIPEHDRLVVHLDADLYSSTRFVLDSLRPHIQRGTIILFDEFSDRQHELRAFDEFLASSGMTFRFCGGAEHCVHSAFERMA